MLNSIELFYVAALRMKAGELMGVRDLFSDIADHFIPRFIVPPQSERGGELQSRLFAGERFPDVSAALSAHWPQRDALVESTYLIDEFGQDRMGVWLPRMFESARRAQARPIPLVTARDLIHRPSHIYRACLDTNSALQLGIVISSGDADDRETVERLLSAVEKLRLAPENCLIIADFADADFTDANVVAPIIKSVLEILRASALWWKIVFQGTNYPENNPSVAGGHVLVPRNEWIAWKRAVKLEAETTDFAIFGDYAADCAKIDFKIKGGAAAIRHYRYTTPEAWLVQRGADAGTHAAVMRQVCQDVLASGYFAGRDFSTADDYIFRTAHGAGGPGAAKEWRAINITHHITRVIVDVGRMRGFEPKRVTAIPLDSQMMLFNQR